MSLRHHTRPGSAWWNLTLRLMLKAYGKQANTQILSHSQLHLELEWHLIQMPGNTPSMRSMKVPLPNHNSNPNITCSGLTNKI